MSVQLSPPRELGGRATVGAPAAAPAGDAASALAALGGDLASGRTSLAEGFARAMRLLEQRCEAKRGALLVAEPERRSLVVRAAYGIAPGELRPRYGLGVGGRVAAGGRPIVVPAVRQEPMALSELTDPAAWHEEHLSLVSVPLLQPGSCGGALSVYFAFERAPDFAGRLGVVQAAAAALARGLPSSQPSAAEASGGGADEAVAFEYSNMIGASAVMRQVYEEIGQVARTSATALVLGESGTGKELVAQAIHENSDRARQPFIKINGAAFPETLFESELFGHERGAFTGAVSRKKGRLDLAQGGTLFLDEIGELPLSTQIKLLRVLQSREYERIGGTETLRANVRLIAATNKNIAIAVAEGAFREDLYYRLNVFTITLPPLRERRGDVPALAEYFLEKYASEHRRRVRRIASGALDALSRYRWPGNVRELENAIERAVVVCEGAVLEEGHLPEVIRTAGGERPAVKQSLAEAVESLERRMIEEAMRESAGNLARASRALGTTERILRYKMSKYQLGRLARLGRKGL